MNRRVFCATATLLALGGCARRQSETTMLAQEECERVITVLLDMSGSFVERMTVDGVAYSFCMDVINQYFAEGIGSEDKLIIAQISANPDPLLWEGKPLDLRQMFDSAGSFRDFLLSKSSPLGSPVYLAMARALEYVTSDPAFANGKTKSAVLVLSDMEDNGPPESSKEAKRALLKYAKQGGVIGLYFVSQGLVSQWRQELQSDGFHDSIVKSEILGRPPFPNFE